MNDWSRRRKRIILVSIVSILIFVVGIPLFVLVYRAPTCFDGKRNGGETGVDCGGSCRLLCAGDSLPLILRGDPRLLTIAPNTYEVVALVDNPNIFGEIYRAGYTFRVYGASGSLPLRTIEGEAHVPRNSPFVVFEGPFVMEEGSNPTRVTFEWKTGTLVWQRNESPLPDIRVTETRLSGESTRPRVDTVLENRTLDAFSDIDLSAVVSDDAGNIFAVAKTFLETLPRSSRVPMIFTWPNPFDIREEACSHPVDIALVLDRSGSMNSLGGNPPQPLSDVRNTAVEFVNQSGPNDRYAIVSFADEASSPMESELSGGFENVRQAINGISIIPGSLNTNIGSGLNSAMGELLSPRARDGADKAIVLLTDGAPTHPTRQGEANYPETYALAVSAEAKGNDISVFTIGLGGAVNMDFLRNVASSPADAYLAPTTAELNSIYRQISTKICRQGLVGVDVYIRVFPDRSFIR